MTTLCPVCGQASPPKQERCITCGGWLDSSMNDPLLGREVGHFRLDQLIGRGGMGAIYKATHKVLGTPYAIKLLHPQLASDPTILERFRREAIAASQLKHSNIVFVADFGWTDGIGAYIVMEFLEGRSLGQALRDGLLFPPKELLDLFRQICRGLHVAHKNGIVHRDLKPDNIFLCELEDEEKDLVKILDFGIARITEEGNFQPVTQSEVAIGTPHYMSPEQAKAQWDMVDQRTDIYALGVLLYKILTGDTPYTKGSTHEILTAKATGQMTPLEVYRPDLKGSPLSRVLDKMLAYSPDDRYENAKEVVQALELALQGLPPTPITAAAIRPNEKITRHLSPASLLPSASSQPHSKGAIGLKESPDPPSFPSSPSFAPISKPSISMAEQALRSQDAHRSNHPMLAPSEADSLAEIATKGNSFVWIISMASVVVIALVTIAIWSTYETKKMPDDPAAQSALLDGGSLPPLYRPSPLRTLPTLKGFTLPSIPTPTGQAPSQSEPILALPDQRASGQIQAPDARAGTLEPRRKTYQLTVNSRPQATVFIKDKAPCKTPCIVQGTQGKSVTIWVRKRGYRSQRYQWQPTKDKILRIDIKRRQQRRRKGRRRGKPGKRPGIFEHVPI